MFDNDEAGLRASVECANLLPVRKVKIAKLQGKDPSDLLTSGRGDKIISAIFEAKSYTPQGIIKGSDTKELLLKENYKQQEFNSNMKSIYVIHSMNKYRKNSISQKFIFIQ